MVRGYGIVDHNNKVALNGSEVMKIADIIGITPAHSQGRGSKTTVKEVPKVQKSTYWKVRPIGSSSPGGDGPGAAPKKTVKATIYRPDSTLDIYRPMFRSRACSVNGKNIVRMELDGNTYDHAITDNQTEWYSIRLAVFYFYKEIYESYRRLLADAYVKEGGLSLELPEGSVRCYKRMNGLWHVAFDCNGSTIHYDLTDQESRMMNRLDGNKAAFNEAKVRLFKEHVARDEANAIVRNLRYDDIGVYPSYVSKDDAPDKIASFISQHQQLMQRLMRAANAAVGTTSMTSAASRAVCQCREQKSIHQ